jgi:hypothetical protein
MIQRIIFGRACEVGLVMFGTNLLLATLEEDMFSVLKLVLPLLYYHCLYTAQYHILLSINSKSSISMLSLVKLFKTATASQSQYDLANMEQGIP